VKENILKDIGDKVTMPDMFNKSKTMTGIISMILVNKKGIKYRATFDTTHGKNQYDFLQEEIIE
jgi:hypothetical protein